MNCIAAWASKTTSNGRKVSIAGVMSSQVKSSQVEARESEGRRKLFFPPPRFASASIVEFARGADCRCGVAPNLNVHSCPNKKSNPSSVVKEQTLPVA